MSRKYRDRTRFCSVVSVSGDVGYYSLSESLFSSASGENYWGGKFSQSNGQAFSLTESESGTAEQETSDAS
jgi:hypothetical protein